MEFRIIMLLADINFVIDLLRKKYDLKDLKDKVEKEIISISLITLSELYTGLHYIKSKLGENTYRKKEFELRAALLTFDILKLNAQIMESAGSMRRTRLAEGKTIDLVDLIIGATALFYDAKAIISRNFSHFNCWELPIIQY